MEKELCVNCNLYIDMLPDEPAEEAVERLYHILECEGVDYSMWSFEEREK